MAELTWNRYGKSSVRLVKVRRAFEPHEIVDLTMDIALEGAFDKVYTDGDNHACLATDTMKNTVYAFARVEPLDHVETFASTLAEYFSEKPGVSLVRIQVAEHPWSRLASHAFVNAGAEEWTTAITRREGRTAVASGLRGLVVLKTTDSAFSGFPRDRYTTLAETRDRILATSVAATWTYADGFQDFAKRSVVRSALLETFAAHRSESVQQTLYAMGEAALSACDGLTDIELALPNRHHLLV
ncbi:MAG TPA: urate oxidase, partial [Vicinamibacterales bacterium]|nr:urate oxidase [Vicinamibacterales bacterium]